MPDPVQRRLAAILAADVAGYSRLMGEDEEGTLAALTAHLTELIEPCIAEHRGRVVKTTGDGLLAEFASVVDAVRCAVAFQEGMAERNADTPVNRRIEFRIGVNLGDVIVQDEDVYGDGVNVAARLEGLAEPGCVCVSGSVHQQVVNKLEVGFDDLGQQSVKNIPNPIHVFRVALKKTAVEANANDPSDAMFGRPAVAVLAFENLSGDPEQEYFADGLTEDIITALSLWRSFPVIARNSTFGYKGQSPDIRKVGEELGARYVIEGSVRKAGNRVRVTAQLINSETGHHVWAERYDRDLDDIFELQDELTQRIAATVAPEVERFEHQRAVTAKPRNLDAWDLVHRGMAHLYEFSAEGNARARETFERAIELDPGYADAYVGIALSHIRDFNSAAVISAQEAGRRALVAARRAVELNLYDSYAHLILGVAHEYVAEFDQAIAEVEMAIELNPNIANGYISMGHRLALIGRGEEGIRLLEKGLSLNPKDPRNHMFYAFMARAHLTAHLYDDALPWARKAVQWKPDAPLPRLIHAAVLGHLGQAQEAKTELDACEQLAPDFLATTANQHPYKHPKDEEHFLDGLRKAGWKG